MGIDRKYGRVSVERVRVNPIEDDEPVFLLRARDVVAPGAIELYAQQCESYGAPSDHVAGIREALVDVIAWQDEHPELVRTPGTAHDG